LAAISAVSAIEKKAEHRIRTMSATTNTQSGTVFKAHRQEDNMEKLGASTAGRAQSGAAPDAAAELGILRYLRFPCKFVQCALEFAGTTGHLKVTPEDSDTSKSLKEGGASNIAKLKTLKGKEFDKAYVDNEVTYHQAVIDALDKTLISEREECRAEGNANECPTRLCRTPGARQASAGGAEIDMTAHRYHRYCVCILLLGWAVLGLDASTMAAPKRAVHIISIEGMQFSPSSLEVRAGDTVIWQNKDPCQRNAPLAQRANFSTKNGAGSPRCLMPAMGSEPDLHVAIGLRAPEVRPPDRAHQAERHQRQAGPQPGRSSRFC
jgi:plastocyanin